jgi:2'-hydroxyisoflavone reductase
MKRRSFLHLTAAAGTAAMVPGWLHAKAEKPLKILILGGTRFIGVHMTELALARGHTLTFFNRGRTKTDLFPQIERIKGDRDDQLEGLKGRKWDAVIDNSGYVPRHVRLSAELLAPSVGQYVFVSSISAYKDLSAPRDESAEVGKLADETVEKVDGETYGPLKALCEQAAERAMPGRTTVLRSGLIVGPEDNTDRFTYWPARAARGGEFLAPGSPPDPVQIIDARDLAAFALRAIENRVTGIYNILSPPGLFTIGGIVDESIAAARDLAKPADPPRATWAAAEFLEAQKVEPWGDMPVWVPAKGDSAGMHATPVARAIAAGLTITPLRTTVRDTLAWHLNRSAEQHAKLRAGIAPEREKEVLAAWHAQANKAPA